MPSMHCPFCGDAHTHVRDSRPAEENAAVRRRRACNACHARFTTYERVQRKALVVVKSEGRKKQPFDREKLACSLRIALCKRLVEEEQLELTVNGIARALEESDVRGEVTSARIGVLAMEALKKLDLVAYVRFASVYRNFQEARDFRDIAGKLDRPSQADAKRNTHTNKT